ncbi:hypothetical protein [Actinomycetospora callitridis]|uniref:hypothetical protein n=1 Tax=Actinomycetospora callitridis TaxID=913944 RepID=UPI0023652098|nr:hypothetical protein [Actinomycetospora callitridis]MDD7921252.1 hypothetical protein [Actinomycetospora callitridis]
MAHDANGGSDDFDALGEAVDEAMDTPGPLEWGGVMRAAWFGVDPDPDAPAPRDIVDRGHLGHPDDQDSG